MSHKPGTPLKGILTPDDLRKRCKVLACGCWLSRSAKSADAQPPAFWFPPLSRHVSAGVAACWWAEGRAPLPGEAWHANCATKRCVNPAHRVKGDRSSQMRAAGLKRSDQTRLRMAAGRRLSGKLSDADVAEIQASTDTLKVLSARYGISIGYACELRARKRRSMALATGVVLTQSARKPGRYEVAEVPALFSSLRVGEYMPADTALARAYGGAR